MSKIYEAMQNAQWQKNSEVPSNVLVPFGPPAQAGLGLEEEMLSLYKIIEIHLPKDKSRIVEFIGSREGEGTSTIVREFARVTADLMGHSVLLLDADRNHPSQYRFFDSRGACCWDELLRSKSPVGGAFYRVGQSKLFFSPSCNSGKCTPEIFNSGFDDMCQNLRTDFDLVVIDTAPMSLSMDGVAIASKVDGVILVVEAEKTRWQSVKRLRDSISRVGGNILGVIFNKRRHYIPPTVYKYL